MKKLLVLMLLGIFIFALAACNKPDYSGAYTGYSWKDEANGVSLEDTTEKIETTLTLDSDGIITAVDMDFLVLKDDQWIKRNDPTAVVSFDTSIEPQAVVLGDNDIEQGISMFDIKVNDTMSLFVVGVDDNGTVAYGVVDPMIRYILESKFDSNYDFSTPIGDLTINNGFVPTIRTSSGGAIKPETWEDIENTSILDISDYSHVYSVRGTYEGITNDTTVQELLELSGVSFVDGTPQPMAATYGYHSAGGWYGNYKNIEETLIGKNATDMKGLVSYTGKAYNGNDYAISVNEENFFGLNKDTVSGATNSIQKSYDTISGATVRMSRENTSFQRALVEAGIIEEDDVIKGRF
ncbi:hypothetical protein GC105_03935 [Alkalibaculum sp. M08DMB]|uniref:Uncharacterized protein n=1 Tax=Alkalibaculum sporogenes TaxID=2655001 RepID=A0A6A7K6Y4_9FIRM|nr:hypothetical protein [Alkalibaculum sporogenes]MPW24937.1 hypothetical protein [Alkalibaculum sporogenes]